MRKLSAVVISFSLALTALSSAQLSGPTVHPDRRVTFRISAPNAKQVSLWLEGSNSMNMESDGKGNWSVVTQPLKPQIYGYAFNVDGQTTLDASNPVTKPNLVWPGNLVLVPGETPQLWEEQSVPRGTVHHHFYSSKLIGVERDYVVYTPANHRKSERLPVLLLLHGYSDTAVGWTAVGRANVILDNLIAQGKAKRMIVVMPLGYGVPNFVTGGMDAFENQDRTRLNMSKLSDTIFGEILPEVKRNYGAGSGRSKLAVAGLSMGGAQSLYIGLNHASRLSAVGAFSSGGFPGPEPMATLTKYDKKAVGSLKKLWMVCGTEDGLIGFQRPFSTWLKEQGAPVVATETSGGHEWMLWRENLAEFAQGIFRD